MYFNNNNNKIIIIIIITDLYSAFRSEDTEALEWLDAWVCTSSLRKVIELLFLKAGSRGGFALCKRACDKWCWRYRTPSFR